MACEKKMTVGWVGETQETTRDVDGGRKRRESDTLLWSALVHNELHMQCGLGGGAKPEYGRRRRERVGF